ncbi:hypothetical protein GCM10027615_13570 [Plantactinospora veratri]
MDGPLGGGQYRVIRITIERRAPTGGVAGQPHRPARQAGFERTGTERGRGVRGAEGTRAGSSDLFPGMRFGDRPGHHHGGTTSGRGGGMSGREAGIRRPGRGRRDEEEHSEEAA